MCSSDLPNLSALNASKERGASLGASMGNGTHTPAVEADLPAAKARVRDALTEAHDQTGASEEPDRKSVV